MSAQYCYDYVAAAMISDLIQESEMRSQYLQTISSLENLVFALKQRIDAQTRLIDEQRKIIDCQRYTIESKGK